MISLHDFENAIAWIVMEDVRETRNDFIAQQQDVQLLAFQAECNVRDLADAIIGIRTALMFRFNMENIPY